MTGAVALTLAVLVLALVALVMELLTADIVLLAGLAALVVAGVIDLERALEGFANPTLLALGALFVVAEGLRTSGVLRRAADLLLGRTRSLRTVLLRLTTTSAAASAFLNNTPIVAMGIPTVLGWAEDREGIRPSKLLIPLSYASIFGGICTLIGTSTNLVADGMLRSHGYEGLGFFELARVGVPLAVVGIVLLVTIVPRFLPEREELHARREREGVATWSRGLADHLYRVPAASGLVGRTVGQAELEDETLQLVRISRGTGLIAPVGPDEELREGDYLTFRGDREPMRGRAERWGLEGVEDMRRRDVEGPFQLREAVVPEGSPLVGVPVRDVNFPDRYGAVVTGVVRHGGPVRREPGRIVLRPGDTLLLEATPGFARAYGYTQDFYLVGWSPEEEEEVERAPLWQPTRAKWGVVILVVIIGLSVMEVMHISMAALIGAIVMVASGFLSPGEARRSVDWSVLIVIGAALGLGRAVEVSGTGTYLGSGVVAVGQLGGELGILAALLFLCTLLTAVITNNAAVALLFPVAVSTAASQGLDPRPFIIAVTLASSLSFATPLGYQTNLMVYGPGGYRFTDFVRVGLPLQIVVGVLAVFLIPMIWPFRP